MASWTASGRRIAGKADKVLHYFSGVERSTTFGDMCVRISSMRQSGALMSLCGIRIYPASCPDSSWVTFGNELGEFGWYVLEPRHGGGYLAPIRKVYSTFAGAYNALLNL